MNLVQMNGLIPSTFQVILILGIMAGISILLIDCLYKKRGNKIEDYCKNRIIEIKTLSYYMGGDSSYATLCSIDTFTSMANDGSVWDFRYLIEQVIKNNMSMIFPMCIALIAGYIISREEKDDVLKNIITIPISFKKLLVGKLIVCAMLSILFGLICTIFTLIAECIVGFPGFTVNLVIQGLVQITLENLLCI